MSDSSDWQHVGRNKPKSKADKEQAFKRMPKVKDLDYQTVQDLMFQYDANEMKGEPLADRSNKQSKQANTPEIAAKGDPKQPLKKKPKKPEHKAPLTIDKALKNENLLLVKKLEQTKSAFPNDSSIWFKETAFYLNMNLKCSDEQLIPNSRPFDFPISNLKENTSKALKNLYSKAVSKSNVPTLFNQYIVTMLDSIARDSPTWGYKLCIQALAHSHPESCCQNLKQYEKKLDTVYNVPKQCTALLWALGQIGFNNPKWGMNVWLEIMLPNLQYKSVSQFAMPYIEMLLKRVNKPLEAFANTIGPKELLLITKWSYGDVNAKGSAIVREKMKLIYPTFQELAVGSKAAMRQTFSGILDRSTNETQQQSDQLSKICLICLNKENGCFKIWKDRYTKRLSQSLILLTFIERDWEKFRSQTPRKELKSTLDAFVSSNLQLEEESDDVTNPKEFKQLELLCEDLQSRLKKRTAKRKASGCRAFFWATALAVVALLIGLVWSDIKNNGGKWESSETYKFLKSNGIIAATNTIWSRLQQIYNVTSNWLVTNIPYYYRTVSAILGPYVDELMTYLYTFVTLVADNAKPAFQQLLTQVQFLLFSIGEWLKPLAIVLLEYLDICFGYVIAAVQNCYRYIEIAFQDVYDLYLGKTTWSDVRSALVECSNQLYEFLIKFIQRIGDYIAPNEP